MRIIVMFDLPTETSADRKDYRDFRKYLIKNGFFMMQESIYCKLVQNVSAADYNINALKNNKPQNGIVQVMKITEKQYSKIEFIVGDSNSEVIDSDDRILFL